MKVYGPYTNKNKSYQYVRVLFEETDTIKTMPYKEYLLRLEQGLFTEPVVYVKRATKQFIACVCPVCDAKFERLESVIKFRQRLGQDGPFCSKTCARKYATVQAERKQAERVFAELTNRLEAQDTVQSPLYPLREG